MQKGANARATCAILCIINIEPKTWTQRNILWSNYTHKLINTIY